MRDDYGGVTLYDSNGYRVSMSPTIKSVRGKAMDRLKFYSERLAEIAEALRKISEDSAYTIEAQELFSRMSALALEASTVGVAPCHD